MNRKLRLFTSVILTITAVAIIGGVFLSKPRPVSASPGPSFPTYVPGSFTFTTSLQLPKPLTIWWRARSIRRLNLKSRSTSSATSMSPAPTVFPAVWISGNRPIKGANFVYLGQPDGAQDKCTPAGPVICQNGLGGGDDSIDVSNGGYLYISSLWGGAVTMSTSCCGAQRELMEISLICPKSRRDNPIRV